jgi:hypothetical protein
VTGGGPPGRIWPIVACIGVLLLAQQLGRDTYVFTHVLTDRVMSPLVALCKLACQMLGCVYAARCAARYDKGTPVRSAWLLASGWLGCFFVGQAILSTYTAVLRVDSPVPSAADLFFFAGYACLIVAILRFISAYRASGFPVGSVREYGLVVAGATLVFALAGYGLLVPIALGPTPLVERLINLGYPVLDMVVLVPTLVLLRITVRFKGGRVWTVWAALLTCIVFSAAGDILFADTSAENVARMGPLVDLLFVTSYLFGAHGTRLQYQLLAG